MLVAVGLVFGADRAIIGSPAVWAAVHQRLTQESVMEYWISLAQARRTRFARERDDRTRVVALGSSRANTGFLAATLPERDRDWVQAVTLGCAGIDAFALRSMVDGVAKLEPDVAVLLISQFDTHRPLYLVPRVIDSDLPSLVELLRYTDASYFWKVRGRVLEIQAGGVLGTYRYRKSLLAAGLDRFGRFEMRSRGPATTPSLATEHFFGAQRGPDGGAGGLAERREEIEARHGGPIPEGEFYQLYSMVRGEHVRAQEAFLESAIARFHRSGVQVLIFETPLNPLGASLWDADLRQDFLAFAQRMVRTHGAWLIPLEESGPYEPEHFVDLTHLAYPGGKRATRQIVGRIRRELATNEKLGSPLREGGPGRVAADSGQ